MFEHKPIPSAWVLLFAGFLATGVLVSPLGPNLSSLRQLRLDTAICQIGAPNERLSITGSLGQASRRNKRGGVGPDYWIHLTRGPRHRGDWAISSRGTGGEMAFAFRLFLSGPGAPGA
jgi:hypothetical protein